MAIKPDFAAVSRTHDKHRLALLIRACARSFNFFKASYPTGCFVCLLDLILYVQSTIFQLCRDGSSWVEPVLS